MTIVTGSSPNSATRAAGDLMRSMVGSRRRLLVLGAIVLGLGAIFKWNWLVAVGIAPPLLAALPCLAMCALGLCMSRMTGGSSGAQPGSADKSVDAAPIAIAPPLLAEPLEHSGNDPTTVDKPANVTPVTNKSCCHTSC